MVQIPNRQIIVDYVDFVVHHRAVQVVSTVTVEMIKIIAAKIILEFVGKKFLHDKNSTMTDREIYATTVFAPVAEEIIFRGILLQGIYLAQRGWNHYFDLKLTDEDRKAQQVFRIRLSALIFAAAHLTNPHKSSVSALIQFTWTYFGGITYGYLTEKYQTLSVSILVHGVNNSLAVAGRVYPESAALCILAVFVNKFAAYTLAVTAIDEKLYSGLSQTAQFCGDLAERLTGSQPTDSDDIPMEIVV